MVEQQALFRTAGLLFYFLLRSDRRQMLGRSRRCSLRRWFRCCSVHVPTWDPLDDSGGNSSAGSSVAKAEAAAAAVAAAAEEATASNGVVAGGVVGAGNRTKVSSMTFRWARS